MKGMSMLTIWTCLLLLAGCDKNCLPEPDPCEINPASCDTIEPVTKLDILWRIPVNPDTSFGLPDLKLISTGLLGNFAPAGNAFLQLHDVDNEGAVKWKWQGFQRSNFTTVAEGGPGSYVICKSWEHRATVNPASGQTNQQASSPHNSNPRAWIIGDRLFFEESNDQDTEAWLLMASLDDIGRFDTIYTLGEEVFDRAGKSIESVNAWIDPVSGDSILVFQHRMHNFQQQRNRVDVLAYNLTQRKVEWQHEDIEPRGQSSVRQVFIHEDKAYFQGSNTIYCFDLLNGGEIRWYNRYLSPLRSFGNSNIVYAKEEDLIIYKNDGEFLTAVDPLTGTVKWEISNAGAGAYPMIYHAGIVYYTTGGSLYAVRAFNGEVMWSERSPSRVSTPIFSGTVAVDPERGLLYACDRYYVMAIRLLE